MGVCSCTSKFIIIFINVIFWIGAAFLVYAGVAYLNSIDGVMNDVHSKPAYITFGVAGLLFLCGLIGIAGAFSEKKVLLGIFTLVIVGTLILLIFISATLFIKENAAMNETDNFVAKQFEHYGSPNLTYVVDQEPEYYGSGNISTTIATMTTAPAQTTTATTPPPAGQTNSTTFIDSIQKSLECCGFLNYTDWNEYEYWSSQPGHKDMVPYSCCNQTAADAVNMTCPSDGMIPMHTYTLAYTQNCNHEVHLVVNFIYTFLEYTALTFCILVFLGFCSTMFLMFRKRRSDGFNYSSIVA